MKKVFIIHGYQGNKNNHWFPWLENELKNRGIESVAPQMPNTDHPRLNEWLAKLTEIVRGLDLNEIIFVGHSLGVVAVLRYLEQLNDGEKIQGAVLVSGPNQKLRLKESDSKIRELDHFFDMGFDYKKIKLSSQNLTVIHARDDIWVPFSHGESLSKGLDVKFIDLDIGGHFTDEDGVSQFPEVLEEILKMINEPQN